MTLLACLRRLEASRTCWMKRSSNTSLGCPGGIIFAKAPRSCSFVTWGPSGPQPFPCSSVRSHRYAIAGGGRGGLLLAMAIVLSMSWMATNRPSTSSWNSSTSGLNDAANAAACPDEGHRSAPRDHGQAPRDVGCKHGHDDCSRRTVRWGSGRQPLRCARTKMRRAWSAITAARRAPSGGDYWIGLPTVGGMPLG